MESQYIGEEFVRTDQVTDLWSFLQTVSINKYMYTFVILVVKTRKRKVRLVLCTCYVAGNKHLFTCTRLMIDKLTIYPYSSIFIYLFHNYITLYNWVVSNSLWMDSYVVF